MAKRNGDFDDEEGFFESLMKHRQHIPMPHSMSKLLKMIVGGVVLLIVGLVTWAVWPSGSDTSEDSVPVIRADEAEYKTTPDEPGGMPIPNKDSTVFESMEKTQSGEKNVENLLEDSEQPMNKDEAFNAESATQGAPETATTESEVADDTPAPTQVAEAEKETVVASEPQPSVRVEEAPVKAVVEKPKENIIETLKKEAGTAKPKPAAKPVKALPKGNVYIQLAAVKSDADTKTKWAKLQSMYPSLKALSLHVQKADLGAKGVFYRVQAGPTSADAATSICAKIKAAKGDCIIAK